MKKIKIAQIGTAHDHAPLIFNALKNLPDIFDLVGYAKVPEDNGVMIVPKFFDGAKEYSIEEIFAMEDLDAVAIETHELNLVKYAKMAVDKGFNVQMDKAGGESEKDFEELLSTVKEKGVIFNMGYMYRYNPVIKDVFDRVKNGELGKVYSVEAEMNTLHDQSKRKWLNDFKGGMMQFLGCHLIDLVVRLLGVPKEIIPYNTCSGFDGVNSLDNAFAVLKYKNGISTVKSSAVDPCGYIRRHLTVYGEKGTIEIRPLEITKGYPSLISSKSITYYKDDNWTALREPIESDNFDRYQGMLIEFAKMVRGERGLEVDLETEARIQRCLLKANGMDIDFKGDIKL